jgi:sulfhydrogenase subunit beta (sulfur reductase)
MESPIYFGCDLPVTWRKCRLGRKRGMAKELLKVHDEVILERGDFQELLDALKRKGYQSVGPKIRDGAVIYDEVKRTSDLPVGWYDLQDRGFYRLAQSGTESVFGYTLGPHSWKKYLHPPVVRLWQANREGRGFRVLQRQEMAPKYALIGVRSCEIHAIAIQDRVFRTREFFDPVYGSIREGILVVAVNCTRPGGTCFCASMNTGPKAKSGFDIALTEVLDEPRHYFVVELGSERGVDLFHEITCRPAGDPEKNRASTLLKEASRKMGRSMVPSNQEAIFTENFEHPRWDEVAKRCLTCGNCTLVCPTCFCNNVEDSNALTGEYAEHWRKWDSCFTKDFSYIHGGSIRASAKSRYRQWLTHKLATWIGQYGTSGCVGCGRCITWCPVGIDITEEAKAILGDG